MGRGQVVLSGGEDVVVKKRRNGRAGPGATEPRLDSDFLASSQPVQSDSPTLRLPRLHPELYNAP